MRVLIKRREAKQRVSLRFLCIRLFVIRIFGKPLRIPQRHTCNQLTEPGKVPVLEMCSRAYLYQEFNNRGGRRVFNLTVFTKHTALSYYAVTKGDDFIMHVRIFLFCK